MAGIEETAINGFVPVFRPLRSVRVGLRRGGADVDAYHHRRRHDVTPLGAPRARPELKRSASLNGTSD